MQSNTRSAPAVATTLLLAAAALAMPRAHATACGAQDDFLARSQPLMATVRPADCATLLGGVPEFAWPLQREGALYTLALTFPDGHTETRSTTRNWLAWDRQVPAGNYTWQVRLSGKEPRSSETRTFHVDGRSREGGNLMDSRLRGNDERRGNDVALPLFRVEAAPTWVPAPETRRKAPTGGVVGAFTQ